MRADIGGDPNEPWVHIALKYLYTAKDSWLGATANLGAIGALYNLTMDPFEKYDMVFNGAAPTRVLSSSPGKYAGQDNGWALSLLDPVMIAFDESIMKYPNIKRYVGGASTDLIPNLQYPENPDPLLKGQAVPTVQGGGG
jgi:arylsulfatase